LSEKQFHRENHYAPQVYLRGFASTPERIFTYLTLVSNERVPPWRERSIGGVARLAHLYTRLAAGQETDEIETWLDREFEAPAAEPLRRAISDDRMTPDDWTHIVRFLAAQMVRTPAYFFQNLQGWKDEASTNLSLALEESVRKLEAAKRSGVAVMLPAAITERYIPISIDAEALPGEEMARVKASMLVGRGRWQFAMRHLLADTRLLHQHRWTILAPAKGLAWFTSDDPVVCLNYYEEGRYDFKGGCLSHGTEIFLPLSPQHLFYTRIGYRPERRGHVLPRGQTEAIRRVIAEHAFRMIFAASQDSEMPTLRSRHVSDEEFRKERDGWQKWHEEQTTAERNLKSSIRLGD
jgi:hypothetical protein